MGRFELFLYLVDLIRRIFDYSFKKMVVELSYAKGMVKEVAQELVIDPSRLCKWRNRNSGAKQSAAGHTEDQRDNIGRLQNELKETQLERDILKKAVSIFSKGDGRCSGS
jgi:transposase